jgi:hypothetical protein
MSRRSSDQFGAAQTRDSPRRNSGVTLTHARYPTESTCQLAPCSPASTRRTPMYRPRVYVEGKYALDFRADGRGGLVRHEPALTGDVYQPRSRHVLLVHGFNSVRQDARTSYEYFRGRLSEELRTIENDLIYVYWPADWAVQAISPLFYREMVGMAIYLGPRLAKALMNFSGPAAGECELVIVAHSLGCRLALEALIALRKTPAWRRFRITLILLAAAIPAPLVAGDPASRDVLGDLVMTGVCFSASDRVLDWAFRLGETRAGSFMPEAVGLRGAPAGVWKSLHGMNLRHTQYWQSRVVASYVAARLGSTIRGSVPTRLEWLPRELPHRPDSGLREVRQRAHVVMPLAP